MNFCTECKSDKLVNDEGSIICTKCGIVQQSDYVDEQCYEQIPIELSSTMTLEEYVKYVKWSSIDPSSMPCAYCGDALFKKFAYNSNENNSNEDDYEYCNCMHNLDHNTIVTNYCDKNGLDKKSYEDHSTKKYFVWNTESIYTKIDLLYTMLNNTHIKI